MAEEWKASADLDVADLSLQRVAPAFGLARREAKGKMASDGGIVTANDMAVGTGIILGQQIVDQERITGINPLAVLEGIFIQLGVGLGAGGLLLADPMFDKLRKSLVVGIAKGERMRAKSKSGG